MLSEARKGQRLEVWVLRRGQNYDHYTGDQS